MNIASILEPELQNRGFYHTENKLEKIAIIQHYFASQFTFENLDVLLKNEELIDEHFLIDKLLVQKRGGLCYELNGTLYLVLKTLDFNVSLVSATIWTGTSWGADRTHSIILFEQNGDLYLVDNGTGTNLPMKPVLLDGDPVISPAGAFRLRTEKTDKGMIVAEMLTNDGWICQYSFDSEPRHFPDELNRSKKMIHEMENSPFNKTLLIAKSLPGGTVSVNDERMNRKWINDKGLVENEARTNFNNSQDLLNAVEGFSSKSTYEAVMRYLK